MAPSGTGLQRLYGNWPLRLLIADEVGLGKTIQTGMLIRQSWLAEKARRILIMVPASICRQWQLELREKFNLNWPVYDGDQFIWLPTPGQTAPLQQPVARAKWHEQPCLIVSSHLMRRCDRVAELVEQAAPWDIVVVDEAHHARRHAPGPARRTPSESHAGTAPTPEGSDTGVSTAHSHPHAGASRRSLGPARPCWTCPRNGRNPTSFASARGFSTHHHRSKTAWWP